jgi:hypothetical protein
MSDDMLSATFASNLNLHVFTARVFRNGTMLRISIAVCF